MKRVVLAIAAALVLIALPAVAQYTDPSTTTQPTTTTTEPSATTTEPATTEPATTTTETVTSPDPNAPVQEERTNPQVPTHGPSSGLTASGSVASWNDDEIVLRTATGMTHFKLLPDTTGVTTFTEGQRLTIDFTRNEQGVLIARQVRPEGTADLNPPGITTPGAAAAGAEVAAAVTDTEPTTTMATETTTESTTETESTESLPETGSKAPLVGLLGLLALGGAAALRRL